MATIFLSYTTADKTLARDLEQRLNRRGHNLHIPVGTPPAGRWRSRLMQALLQSQVHVPLLSELGLGSNFISSEIGSARVLEEMNRMLLLPVIIGQFHVPPFVNDFHCFHLPETSPDHVERVAGELDAAIQQHLLATPKMPRIFISHRHEDKNVAAGLVRLLEAAFQLDPADIRCTSVQPYTLPAGERTSARLRAEIGKANVVLGLLAPDTSESRYVLAELGAAWGLEVPTFPLLVRGAKHDDVPAPLNERVSLSLADEANCTQLIENLNKQTALALRVNGLARITEQARELARLASAPEPTSGGG